jgi:hypothetical protein
MRIGVAKYAEQPGRANRKAGFLVNFAHYGQGRPFAWLDRTGW